MQRSESPSSHPLDRTHEGYRRAIEQMHACVTEHGFLASPTHRTNYRRIWSRDGIIVGLAALLADDRELVTTFRRTLHTLADHQGAHGQIPSNVDPDSGDVSYGGIAGRVDASLWFPIAVAEYWAATGDEEILRSLAPALERVRFLIGAWEFNERGLIYVPHTGDWADEFVQGGYVLYDQLLYLQAQRSYHAIDAALGREPGGSDETMKRLYRLIRENYWFQDDPPNPNDVYHEGIYEKGWQAAESRQGVHWLPFFGPHGYGYRFDALANVLVSLFDVSDDTRRARVEAHIRKIAPGKLPLLPAFHPVIKPVDRKWHALQMTFSTSFQNAPHAFQNGGLWAFITGFHVADLARRGEREEAERFLDAVHRANALEMDGEPWGFAEYVNGKTLEPGGTRGQCWSASAAVMGTAALEGRPVFRVGDRGHVESA